MAWGQSQEETSNASGDQVRGQSLGHGVDQREVFGDLDKSSLG